MVLGTHPSVIQWISEVSDIHWIADGAGHPELSAELARIGYLRLPSEVDPDRSEIISVFERLVDPRIARRMRIGWLSDGHPKAIRSSSAELARIGFIRLPSDCAPDRSEFFSADRITCCRSADVHPDKDRMTFGWPSESHPFHIRGSRSMPMTQSIHSAESIAPQFALTAESSGLSGPQTRTYKNVVTVEP